MEARLQAAEMWFYRRMLKVSWVGKVSNAEVLRRAGVQQDLVLKIIHRQISFIGHVLRKGQLEEAALTGRIQGKRARGRQRGSLLGWLERATGFRPLDFIKMMRQRREEEAVTATYARVLARHTD